MTIRWTLLIAFVAAWPLAAHHSLAADDTTKPVTLKGVVTQVDWYNPHVSVLMDVKDATGKVVSWRVTIAPPMRLKQLGVTKDSFTKDASKPGETTVDVWVAKDGSRLADGRDGGILTLPGGKKIDVSSGVWLTSGGNKIVFGPTPAK